MARPINPTSRRQKLLKASEKLGIPYNVLLWRVRAGKPLKAPYMPKTTAHHEARVRAKAAGKPRYIGQPCKHCGSTERFTTSGGCTTCT